jgi:hypothetical protein
MPRILIIGETQSGKSTLAKRLCEVHQFHAIETASILRAAAEELGFEDAWSSPPVPQTREFLARLGTLVEEVRPGQIFSAAHEIVGSSPKACVVGVRQLSGLHLARTFGYAVWIAAHRGALAPQDAAYSELAEVLKTARLGPHVSIDMSLRLDFIDQQIDAELAREATAEEGIRDQASDIRGET